MKAAVAAFNQEKALVGAFSVITNLEMELFQALTQRSEQRIIKCGVIPKSNLQQSDLSWRSLMPPNTHMESPWTTAEWWCLGGTW